MKFYCPRCGRDYPPDGSAYKCECGGLFQLHKQADEIMTVSVSLGEIETPVIQRRFAGREVFFKLDYLLPSGSFKDRGAFFLINRLKELGIKEVVEDSSGNAGAAIAAYCAAAGIRCRIYLPASTSEGKVKQIRACGAEVIKVPGTRDDTGKAVQKVAQETYYASHIYNPFFFEGVKSIAGEIAKQTGIPDYVFTPVGHGTMLLGLYLGFKELGKLPRIIGVQSENCCPLYLRYHGEKEAAAKPTVAEGIATARPARIEDILAAVKESDGDIITVREDSIIQKHAELCRMGIYIEPTAAVAPAGVEKFFLNRPEERNLKIAVPLTGSGLKK